MEEKVSIHKEGITQECILEFINSYSRVIKVFWTDFTGIEKLYFELHPKQSNAQCTYDTHLWCIRDGDGQLFGRYAGPSASLEVNEFGKLLIGPLNPAPPPKPEWGSFKKRADALGIPVMAYDIVPEAAVERAVHLLSCMLCNTPSTIMKRLTDNSACLAIIGRQQVPSDIPAHSFMRWQKGARDIDKTTRGLGGTMHTPTTSCGEENLTMIDDKWYPHENILIHEFGHTVMCVGMTDAERQHIQDLYEEASSLRRYTPGIYMMENADEYWAEGCQSWFDATARTDVNDSVNTRERLRAHDPQLAAALQNAFGDGSWRFPHDSPVPLISYPSAHTQAQRNSRKSFVSKSDELGDRDSRDPPVASTLGQAVEVDGGREGMTAPSVEEGMMRDSWSCMPKNSVPTYLPCAGVGCFDVLACLGLGRVLNLGRASIIKQA